MTPHTTSVAMTAATVDTLRAHVDRPDGQEDICLATYRPSTGATRTTALSSSPRISRALTCATSTAPRLSTCPDGAALRQMARHTASLRNPLLVPGAAEAPNVVSGRSLGRIPLTAA
jgi:hypothetical protein